MEPVCNVSKKHLLKVSLMAQGSLKTFNDFMGPLIITRSKTTDLNEHLITDHIFESIVSMAPLVHQWQPIERHISIACFLNTSLEQTGGSNT